MSITPLAFSGVSKFSADFQKIVDRAVAIAKLPVTALQNHQADLVQEKLLATNLATAVAAVGTAVQDLGSLGANGAVTASSSDESKVTATATDASAGSYFSITNITSLAHAAAETSVASYPDGAALPGDQSTFSLVAGGTTYPITLDAAHQNLEGLRDAINAKSAGVTASILTTGTGTYLSVAANTAGETTLTLTDSTGAGMLTTLNQGANTKFLLNGAPVSKPSTLIDDVVPGVSFTINDLTDAGQTVNVTLASSRDKVQTALSTLVDAYNTVADQVNAQTGQNAGLLSGHSTVRQVRSAMLALTTFTGGSGAITSLTDLGIELDTHGKMSLNSGTLSGLTDAQFKDAFSFLGSAVSGLGALEKNFTQISDPVTGSLKTELDSFAAANTRIDKQVSDMTERIANMQLSLNAKLQAADGILAGLESQQNMLTANIDSLNAMMTSKSN